MFQTFEISSVQCLFLTLLFLPHLLLPASTNFVCFYLRLMIHLLIFLSLLYHRLWISLRSILAWAFRRLSLCSLQLRMAAQFFFDYLVTISLLALKKFHRNLAMNFGFFQQYLIFHTWLCLIWPHTPSYWGSCSFQKWQNLISNFFQDHCFFLQATNSDYWSFALKYFAWSVKGCLFISNSHIQV